MKNFKICGMLIRLVEHHRPKADTEGPALSDYTSIAGLPYLYDNFDADTDGQAKLLATRKDWLLS